MFVQDHAMVEELKKIVDFQGGSTPEGIPTPMDISHSSGSAFQ